MNTLLKILVSPQDAYALIKEEGGMALPMVIVLVFVGLSGGLIYSFTDMEAAMAAQGLNEEQIAAATQATGQMFGVGGAVLAACIGYVIILLIHALYLKVVSSIAKDAISFADWMSFVSWGRIPYVIGFIVTIVAVLVAGEATESTQNLLSVSNYVPSPSSMWGGPMASSLDLPLIWALAVMTVGYRVWTEKSMVASASIVCGPFVVFYVLVWLLG